MNQHITIRPARGIWVARAGGAIMAESRKAVELIEGNMPPVIYFPRDDVAMAFLERSENRAYCPHKGNAVYYGIHARSGLIADAAWSYEQPHDNARDITGHIAFYPDRVVVEQI